MADVHREHLDRGVDGESHHEPVDFGDGDARATPGATAAPPSARPRSTTGTTAPRRSITPSIKRRRIGQRRHRLPAHDFAHLRDVDRVRVAADLEAAEGHVIVGDRFGC